MGRRRGAVVNCLEAHPNVTEILGVLARLPHIADTDLPRLADAWKNTVFLADARAKALSPDSPLVIEVLAAFEAVQALFADDVRGEAHYVTIDSDVVTIALKAVRDAIAAAYSKPILGRSEYSALMRAWRDVYSSETVAEPDLGVHTFEVKALLAALPRLATRCHDDDAARDYNAILATASRLDEGVRARAREEAWQAAVLTSRRRVWGLVRRSGAESLSRYCADCRRRNTGADASRVLATCLDAACALLVADAIDDTLIDVLTVPVRDLIPAPRPAG